MPSGAATTNTTSMTPTTSTLISFEIVTVTICCSELSRIAHHLERDAGLNHARIFILLGNLGLFAIVLAFLARRPPSAHNLRVPVAGSRYNPQFRQMIANQPSA